MKRVFIICGEKSGDFQGSYLVKAMKALNDDIEFYAIGGNSLKEAGAKILINSTSWGCIGIIEGIKKFPIIYPVLKNIKDILIEKSPDLVILIDFRFFNLKVAKIAKQLKIPVIYYFSPVSWAGKGGKKLRDLASYADLSLLTFPFAIEDYKNANVKFEYIGHPTIEIINKWVCKQKSVSPMISGRNIICLLPGSREKEINLILPVFLKACEMIKEKLDEAIFVILLSDKTMWKNVLARLKNIKISVYISDKDHFNIMRMCDLMILASGSATVEGACLLKPMIVGYKVSFLTKILIRMLINVKYISIPNIIMDKEIIPEFKQESLTPENIAREALSILFSLDRKKEMKNNLSMVNNYLNGENSLSKAAKLINDFLLN